MVRVGKGGGSAPPAAAPERVGPPASKYVAGAARGEAEALCRLAVCYYEGDGVPKSYERAKELAQQAADKGHAIAQGCLGDLHREGKGVPQSSSGRRSFTKRLRTRAMLLRRSTWATCIAMARA
jgi:TPR repeat protein